MIFTDLVFNIILYSPFDSYNNTKDVFLFFVFLSLSQKCKELNITSSSTFLGKSTCTMFHYTKKMNLIM